MPISTTTLADILRAQARSLQRESDHRQAAVVGSGSTTGGQHQSPWGSMSALMAPLLLQSSSSGTRASGLLSARFSTGYPILDEALSGNTSTSASPATSDLGGGAREGFSSGSILDICGPPLSGKTTIALKATCTQLLKEVLLRNSEVEAGTSATTTTSQRSQQLPLAPVVTFITASHLLPSTTKKIYEGLYQLISALDEDTFSRLVQSIHFETTRDATVSQQNPSQLHAERVEELVEQGVYMCLERCRLVGIDSPDHFLEFLKVETENEESASSRQKEKKKNSSGCCGDSTSARNGTKKDSTGFVPAAVFSQQADPDEGEDWNPEEDEQFEDDDETPLATAEDTGIDLPVKKDGVVVIKEEPLDEEADAAPPPPPALSASASSGAHVGVSPVQVHASSGIKRRKGAPPPEEGEKEEIVSSSLLLVLDSLGGLLYSDSVTSTGEDSSRWKSQLIFSEIRTSLRKYLNTTIRTRGTAAAALVTTWGHYINKSSSSSLNGSSSGLASTTSTNSMEVSLGRYTTLKHHSTSSIITTLGDYVVLLHNMQERRTVQSQGEEEDDVLQEEEGKEAGAVSSTYMASPFVVCRGDGGRIKGEVQL